MTAAREAPSTGVPVLTEVVELGRAAAVPPTPPTRVDAVPAPGQPAATPLSPAAEQALALEHEIAEQVYADVQRQIDLMLEYRLREVLAPALERAMQGLVDDVRNELASTLREVVSRAVAQELSRHRRR